MCINLSLSIYMYYIYIYIYIYIHTQIQINSLELPKPPGSSPPTVLRDPLQPSAIHAILAWCHFGFLGSKMASCHHRS